MNAYKHLKLMCHADFVRKAAEDNTTRTDDDIPFRLKYILSRVHKATHDKFIVNSYGREVVGHNAYRYIDVGAPTTIVFVAHHDVARHGIQNCNDNTASVCHLLELAERFSKQRKQLNHNVCLAWVDYEERCSTTIAGASQLARKIKNNDFGKVCAVVNLELTSCGAHYWYNSYGPAPTLHKYLEEMEFSHVFCAINDAHHLDANGVAAVCIGSLRDEDRQIVVEQGRAGCQLWRSCHQDNDTVEQWAVEVDMICFNEILFRIAIDMVNNDNAVYDTFKTGVDKFKVGTFGSAPIETMPSRSKVKSNHHNHHYYNPPARQTKRANAGYTIPHDDDDDDSQFDLLDQQERQDNLFASLPEKTSSERLADLEKQVAKMQLQLDQQQRIIDALKHQMINASTSENP